jgi:F0F1-type ATP synthase membrane subunit b/b'
LIKAKTEVEQANYHVTSQKIREQTEFDITKTRYEDEIKREEDLLDVEISSRRALIEIEIDQFRKTVDAIGSDTIVQMARAGPET